MVKRIRTERTPNVKNIPQKLALISLFCLLSVPMGISQKVGVKTNLLYGAYTYTPNLGIEIGVGKRSTLDIGGGYNPWNLNGTAQNNQKQVHWLGQIEYRHWLCTKFNGHFFGIHALGSQYNIAGHELPLLFGTGSKNYRYEGWGAGGGVSYGYTFFLSNRWSVEANIGIGYAYLNYDKYNCVKCAKKLGNESRNYFGPTKAGISIIYLIK